MITPHLTSADELWGMPRGRDRRELVRGELRIGPLAGAIHGIVSATITSSLHQFVTKHQLGLVVGTGGSASRSQETVTVYRPPLLSPFSQPTTKSTGVTFCSDFAIALPM